MAQSMERSGLPTSEHSHLPTRIHNRDSKADSIIGALHNEASDTMNITNTYKN